MDFRKLNYSLAWSEAGETVHGIWMFNIRVWSANLYNKFKLDKTSYLITQKCWWMFVLGQMLSILYLCESKIRSHLTWSLFLPHSFFVLTNSVLIVQIFLAVDVTCIQNKYCVVIKNVRLFSTYICVTSFTTQKCGKITLKNNSEVN